MLKLRDLSYKTLFYFSLPSILACLLEPLASVVDTAFVGHLKTDWLAALAVSTVILNSFAWIFNFLVHATTQGISAAHSPQTIPLLKERIRMSLYTAVVVGILASLVIWSIRFFLYEWAGAGPKIVDIADGYFKVRIFGYIFFVLYTTLISILRGLGRVHLCFILMTASTLLNILLNYFFLYIQKMDIVGAAYGTVAANILGCFLSVIFLFKMPQIQGLFATFLVGKQTRLSFGKNSRDIFLRTGAISFVFFFSNRLAAQSGILTLAAHQILLQIYLLSSFFTDGVAVTATVLGTRFFTMKQKRRLRIVSYRILHLGACIGAIFSLIYFFGGLHILELFTKDLQVIKLCLSLWPLIYLPQTISSLSFSYDGIMFGLGEFAYLRTHMLVAAFLVFLPTAVLISFFIYPLWGIWWGFTGMNIYRMAVLHKHARKILSR